MPDTRTPFERWFDAILAEAATMTPEQIAALPEPVAEPVPAASIAALEATMAEVERMRRALGETT